MSDGDVCICRHFGHAGGPCTFTFKGQGCDCPQYINLPDHLVRITHGFSRDEGLALFDDAGKLKPEFAASFTIYVRTTCVECGRKGIVPGTSGMVHKTILCAGCQENEKPAS